jgi:hypothetical protein
MRCNTRALAHRSILAALLLAAAFACASAQAPSPPPLEAGDSRHGYALLYEILGQEKKVSQLLIIKRDREALGAVIGAIAETCGKAHERLEKLAEQSPRLDLTDTGLPADEVRARELIAATRRDLLLASSGKELELQLLLTQNEALTYAAHLADALSRSESNPERLEYVRALWKDLTRLLQETQALLRHPVQTAR